MAVVDAQSSLASALARLGSGEIIVLYDERTDHVDLFAAADLTDAATVNTMVREARGFLALALSAQQCDVLGLREMKAAGSQACGDRALPLVTIEAREGVSTGISSADRARTIRCAAIEADGPRGLVSPGHVFPLRAAPGGLLERRGRVEAAIDAMLLAGLNPAATICDVLAEDGQDGRLDDAVRLSERLGLASISIEQIRDARLDSWAVG